MIPYRQSLVCAAGETRGEVRHPVVPADWKVIGAVARTHADAVVESDDTETIPHNKA